MIISIDLWGTLIKGSPLFGKEKLKFTKDYLKFNESDEFILNCFSETKKELNSIIESTGWQPEENLLFSLLFSKLTHKTGHTWNPNYLEGYINRYQHLAWQYAPHVYSDETIMYLELLSQKATLIASSNTLFIKGETMTQALQRNGIGKYFKASFFSDIVGVSKPSKAMFMVSDSLNISTDFHIGDNINTDGAASQYGSTPFIINSNHLTIKDAYNFVIQNGSI